MGFASRRKNERIKKGEIIKVRSDFGMPPYGIYQFEGISGGMFQVSAGNIFFAVNEKHVQIVERKLPKPKSWLPTEISVIKAQLEICDCEDCRTNLAECERKLQEWKLNQENQNLH